MLTTRNQSQVSISGLTYNNLLQDTYNALRDSDAFKKNFTDFTSNTAERMITELYAYIATQLANRLDQMGNELFIDTASASGMSRLLKLVGAKVDFPSAANTYVNVTTSSNTNPLSFSTGIDNGSTELNYTSNAFKSVTASNNTNWEFINYVISEDDGEYVFDYTTKYNFTAPSQVYQIYEGKTQSLEYTVRSINTDIITLTGSPVIKNSVRIYYKRKVMNSGTNAYEIAEFKKVENFFTTEALTAKVGTFTVRNLGNGKCEITIKPYYNEDTQVSDLGKELLIMYRVGGGSVGNISIGAIDRTERFTTTGGASNIDVGYGLLNIYNTKTGSGGLDELTTDQIRSTVINEVRNTKIAVTEEDYEYLFPKYDSEIALIKCYGEKQDDIADLSETYGYYVNPLNVWLLILKYNKEFYDAYLADTTGITSRINDIAFSVLDINPRFNEKYQVNAAFLNQHYDAVELPQYFEESSSTYSLPIDPEGVKLLSNGGCYITVTSHPYVESSSPGRRGVNAFRRYNANVIDTISWTELLNLTSATVGDTYIISTIDGSGSDEIYSRWTCINTFEGTIAPEDYATYWKKVGFDYVYSNLINSPETASEDIMYVVQDSLTTTEFKPVYSYLNSSFVGDWSKLLEDSGWTIETEEHVKIVKFPVNTEININGNSIMVEKDTEFATAQDFCDFLNAHAVPSTYMLTLKENISTSIGVNDYDITNVVINHNDNYVSTGTVTLVLAQNGETTNVAVDVSTITNYGQLVNAINDRFDQLNISSKYHAGLYNDSTSECWNLVIISPEEFSYEDFGTEITNHSSLYVYYLNNNIPDSWPLYADLTVLGPEYADQWADYLTKNSQNDIAKLVNGNIVLQFDDNGSCTLSIPYSDTIHKPIQRMFKLEGQEATAVANFRRITVSYVKSSSGDTAYVRIKTQSASDLLNVPVYINIFSASNGRIRLGEYYENISDHLTGVPDVVLDLLKRDRIKNLYSTNYINEEPFASVDKYGSNYQLKFSSKLIGEETYNQLSASLAPAYVVTAKFSTDTMPYYTENDFFYLKVDNVNYEGGVEIEPIPRSGVKYEVPQENGYAKFNLSWFNSASIYNFASALAYTLSELGPIVEGQPTPLLMVTNYGDGDYVKIYTKSSAYYSSIDFGKTASTTLSNLFGIDESIIVYSEEGEIDVEQIKYKYLSLSSNLAINQTIDIEVTDAGGDVISDSVAIGYSLLDFITNMASSNVKDYVKVDNGRVVFTELTNNASVKFTVNWYSKFQHDSWENMFTPESWSNFVETQNYKKTSDVVIEPGKTYYTYDVATNTYNAVENPVVADINNYYEADYPGTATCTFLNKGDYYIDLEVVTDDDGNEYNQFWFTVQNTASFPYGDIYFHMFEDYSNDHIVKETEGDIVYTDEYNWNRLMTDKRVMLTEHVYKQPRFVPFDLGLTCYLPNSESFSQINYQSEIANFLREQYGIYANNIGVEILPDNIIFNIKDHFSKVVKVVIDYLGYDINNKQTNQYSLTTDFNQIHILSASVREQGMVTDPETGQITIEDEVLKHGLDLKIKYRSA